MKDPKDPIDPKDKLGLPGDFGKPTNIVLPFGKRAMPPMIPPDKVKSAPPVIEYKLNTEEVAALRAFLHSKFSQKADFAGPAEVRLEGDEPEDSPINMLRGLIKDIENGKVHPVSMFVGMIEYKGNSEEDYPFYCTGLSRLAVRGLLHEYLENLP